MYIFCNMWVLLPQYYYICFGMYLQHYTTKENCRLIEYYSYYSYLFLIIFSLKHFHFLQNENLMLRFFPLQKRNFRVLNRKPLKIIRNLIPLNRVMKYGLKFSFHLKICLFLLSFLFCS